MVERQASEPAIVGVMSKIECRADGVPPLHAIGDDRAFRQAGCTRGIHDGLWSAEVNESAQGNVFFRQLTR